MMRSNFSIAKRFAYAALAVSLGLNVASRPAASQQTTSARQVEKPETVEWVYRVRYGYQDEWFKIFRTYQLPILEKQKELGYVKNYSVWAPSLHTSEDSRWDYRVVITRASHDAPPGASESDVARQLFPDQEAFERAENRRWELTANHWDLPIHTVEIR